MIHVEGFGLVSLGKTCRLCLRCETLIAHKAELDKLIGTVATVSKPDYFVLGTADRRTYRRGLAGAASLDDVKAHTSDFESYWSVEITPGGWYPKNEQMDALAPTEDELRLLDAKPDLRALELGCGSGHSLLYLAERGARELWGIDLSPIQIAFAEETLRPFARRVRLIESPMEVDPGVPSDHFDLVFSIYGLGWTTDLPATMALVARYLRPGGCFVISGEHPVYSCLEWNGAQYTVSEPYFSEGPREYGSWKGVPIVIQRRTLGTFVGQIIQAGLQIEALVETPLNAAAVKEAHGDPARWYSAARARVMPTTFIIKARTSSLAGRAAQQRDGAVGA